ncbi:helix-turn-helix domain-containing protein [Mycobacterium gastri]|uniref:helix-turn-helix domain-containing protein n=1 Tax=Mycobacterium gastri TaxID=1777 RepID=UPI001FC9D56E|nr:helix-turn-helix domain-containing protein [Mycobacterium gastri]
MLGDLARDDENDGRLRETLRVFLGCGASYKMAAAELNMHFNTVKYRVGRAIARRPEDRQRPARRRTRVARLSLVWRRGAATEIARPAGLLGGRGREGVHSGDDRRDEEREQDENKHSGDGQVLHDRLTFLSVVER